MPSIREVASRELTKERTFMYPVPQEDGRERKIPVKVGWYPNRMTLTAVKIKSNGHAYDPDDEAVDDEEQDAQAGRLRQIAGITKFLAYWDMTGPVDDETDPGNPVRVVEEDAVIPLEPEILQHVSFPFLVFLNNAIHDIEFPNRSGSRRSRR